jgi:hypothetical protein
MGSYAQVITYNVTRVTYLVYNNIYFFPCQNKGLLQTICLEKPRLEQVPISFTVSSRPARSGFRPRRSKTPEVNVEFAVKAAVQRASPLENAEYNHKR